MKFAAGLMPVGIGRYVMTTGNNHHLYVHCPDTSEHFERYAADQQVAIEQGSVEIQSKQAVLHAILQE